MIELKEEQRFAIEHNEGDLLVSASAGSGKTFVMISRLIRLIKERKADVSEVLAMTFTEAAASDMKEKLKKALIKEVVESGDEYLLSQSKKIATADISTIHAFCARLVRIYFHVAGVSHDFGIAEGLTAERLRQDAINKTFRYFYSVDDEVFKKIATRHSYKRADKEFKKSLIRIYDFFNSEANPDNLMERFFDMYSESGLSRFVTELIERFKEELHPLSERVNDLVSDSAFITKPKLRAFIRELKTAISECVSVKTYGDLLRVKNIKILLSVEKKLDETELEIKAQAVKVRDEFERILNEYTAEIFDETETESVRLNLKEHVDCIIRTVKKFREIYSDIKCEENVLDFDDLQHFALKVLADEQVIKAVKEKYKYIFIDEYQDVNGVQEQIINLISENNVFMVGDVKQSIYGFRGCSPDFFLAKYDKMSSVEGQTVNLNHSFRSANNVIDAVNEIFSFCMTENSFGLDYKKTSKLVAGGIYKDGFDGRFQLHLLKKPNETSEEKEVPRIYNVLDEITSLQKSSAKIASLITKIINDETCKKFYDAKTGAERFVSYKDIAVLTRKKDDETVMGIISGLKSRGIPVVTDASEDITAYPEIRMMIGIIKLIDCFYDSVALATVLKSPVCGFSDEDLMEMALFFTDNSEKKYTDFLDAYELTLSSPTAPLHQKVKDFDAYFNYVRELADYIPISDVLNKIVKDKDIEAFLYAQTDGVGKVKRLRRFLSFTCSGGKPYTAKDILCLIEENKDGIPFLPVDDADAVTVMTIHGSKGLEFPVVIVCGMEKEFGIRHESDEFLFDRADGVAVKLYDSDRRKKETLWRKVFKKRMRVSVSREEMRILYVALTRATYSLHLVYESKEDLRRDEFLSPKRYIDCVPKTIPQTEYEYADLDFEEKTVGVRKVIVGKCDDGLKELLKKNFSYEYPFKQDTTLPLKSSVTSAVVQDEPVYVMFDEYEEKTDKELGITAHKFMQNVPLADIDVKVEAEKMIKNGIMTAAELNRINLEKLGKVFKTDVFKCSAVAKFYREKSFLCNISARELLGIDSDTELLMQGVIDLLILDGDDAKIVDYKYSALSSDSLRAKYRKQLNLYAVAAERSLGVKVKEKSIVSLLSGEVIKID